MAVFKMNEKMNYFTWITLKQVYNLLNFIEELVTLERNGLQNTYS